MAKSKSRAELRITPDGRGDRAMFAGVVGPKPWTPSNLQRGGARIFKRLDALAAYVRRLGLSRFNIDLRQWGEGDLMRGM